MLAMSTVPVTRLFLLGLPGSGKTTAGRLVAQMLGWSFADTDALIEEQVGMSVPRIFAEDGESRFRALETAALERAAATERVVIAAGGGAVSSATNRSRMREAGWRVALSVAPSVALARLTAASLNAGASTLDRPLLAGPDPLLRLHALYEQRRHWYAEADDVVATDARDATAVAARVVAGLVGRGLVAPDGALPEVRRVHPAAQNAYESVVAWGGLAQLGERVAGLDLPRRIHLVSDAHVNDLYGELLLTSLTAAGCDAALWTIPAGEGSKSRAQLDAIYDWLVERRAERGEAIVALGGGVVGDLAGFAAATYLRGMPLIHVPTSLLAQVDASIGGKVGIDHPRGKNLIGAFHQPRLVLADPAALLTLPARARREGWAEAIKLGIVLDATYFVRLEGGAIAGSVALKAGVIEADERERDDGPRQLLNYGHTIGHALETVTGYGNWLHGEAVAVGMTVAAGIGRRLGLTPPDVAERQAALLETFDLPTRCPGISAEALLHAALWDKKVRGGAVRWVIPTELGTATCVRGVPDAVVRAALLDVGATDAPAEKREG